MDEHTHIRGAPRKPNEEDADLGPLRVLVVDDDADVRALVRHVLQRAATSRGIDVLEVGLLRPAVELLRSGERFDAIILDLEMPDTTGQDALHSVTSVLAAQPAHDAPPVIVLTGRHEDLGARSVRVGAEDFVRKSALVEQLVGSVERAVERRAREVRARQEGWRQLRAAAQLEQLAADMSRHVRAPLATAMIGLETVADHAGELDPDRQRSLLQGVRQQLSQLDDHLADALEQVAASREDAREPVQIHDAMTASLSRCSERERGRVLLEVVGEPTVWGRPGAIEDAFSALLRDALHRGQGAPVRLRVEVENDQAEVVLRVSDDAPPARALVPDHRGEGPGLWERVVSLNAAAMGGWLRPVQSALGGQAVEVVLPQRGRRVAADTTAGRRAR